jgi:hypothetical protein
VGVWERLRRSDERITDSPAGWLLPGGAAYKLGRRSGREGTDPRWRRWPFVAGLLDVFVALADATVADCEHAVKGAGAGRARQGVDCNG